MSVYCLFVKTGREKFVENFIVNTGYRTIGAQGIVNEPRPWNKLVQVKRALLPGYVFMESDVEPDWKALKENSDILKPLAYDDGNMALRGRDLEFVFYLKYHGGFLGMSRAYKEGTRVRIIDGPLKAYEGSIVRLNTRRRSALIKIDEEGFVQNIWLPYELLGQG